MSFNQGKNISGASGYVGQYSTHIYTQRAIAVVQQHVAEHAGEEVMPPLFQYLAYQNVRIQYVFRSSVGSSVIRLSGPLGVW